MADNNFQGYPGASAHWNPDSRPLSEATNVLRTFVTQNIVQDSQWEIDRITHYYLYWKFYQGLHYKDFNDGLLSFNYVRAFIDKVNMFLLGDDAFTLHVKSYYTTQISKELESVTEQILNYHWAKSKKDTLAYELLQMGSICGDVWLGAEWDAKNNFVRLRVYDSRQTFPVFEDNDYNKLKHILFRLPLARPNNGADGEVVYKMFVTKISDNLIESWYQDSVTVDETKATKYKYSKTQNSLGFIPVVHIKNKPNSGGYFGISDANDILKINKVYNEILQQLKSIIDYNATPTTVITGASAKSLKRGLGTLWSGLPAEANVFNLGLDVDLSAVTNFAQMLKTGMHELSDVPENALGKIQAISNTSGAALQITYQPLIQQAKVKALTYGEGISQMNNIILKIVDKMDPDNPRVKELHKQLNASKETLDSIYVEPVFPFGFPRDYTDELNRAQMEKNMGIASKREIMERLGKENIPELLKEVDEDALHEAMLQMSISKDGIRTTEEQD